MSTITRSARAAVDVEEIQTTKSEKLLAVVLAIFLLIGAIWTYQELDDWVAETVAPVQVELSAADQAAIAQSTAANQRFAAAQTHALEAQSNLELKREAYRTALDAGQPANELEREYEAAQAELAQAQDEASAAQADVEASRPAAAVAYQHQQQQLQTKTDRHELVAFLLRLGLAVGLLGFGYWLMGRLRRTHSRYFPVALAVVGSAAVLALALAADYVTDYVDPVALGPLVLAVVGIGLTLAAFAALQRYLARRVPVRRVRKHECPFCGYPVGQNEHCEGCGRQVVAECASCAEPRRVGTLHCGACGQA
jgi:cell division septum initiation protein DivIVA